MPRLLFILPIILLACSCSNDNPAETPVDDAHLFEVADSFAQQYAKILANLPTQSQETEATLLDINSRCNLLIEQGDTLLAEYFHHAVEQRLRNINPDHANAIFGSLRHF